MKRLMFAAAICGALATAFDSAQAQQVAPGANAPRYGVAVVDVSYVFKNYPRFTQALETLKTEMEAADGQLKAQGEQLAQLEQQRNTLKPGTAEFKKADEDLARLKADFSIKQGTMRRDFLEREAKIYYDTYNEVSNAVTRFAMQNNIGLVLRFNGDPIDPQRREDVMRAIMQPIIYQNSVDITPDILTTLNRGVAASQSATRPGAAAR